MKKLYARKIRELCANPELCAEIMSAAFQPAVEQGLMSQQNIDRILEKLSESGFYVRLGDITESIMFERYGEEELQALIELYTEHPSFIKKMPAVSVEINARINQLMSELELDELLEDADV